MHARIHIAVLETELGGNDHLIADRGQCFTHPFLVGERTKLPRCQRKSRRSRTLLGSMKSPPAYRGQDHRRSSIPCSRARWPILLSCFFQVFAFALFLLTNRIGPGYDAALACCCSRHRAGGTPSQVRKARTKEFPSSYPRR